MSSGWESLYHKAAGDYNNGNFKDSYTNYLKAANALLYKLGHEVTFANKDAVKSKPSNSARLFQQLKSCVQRLEDILQNRTTNGIPSPKLSFTSDIATSILTNNPQPTYLPMIPFSPLTRQSIVFAHDLANISQKVSIAKQKNDNNLSSIRKLDEELRQQRTKLDNVNNNIQSIAEVSLVHWDADAVAQQLTIIDSQLYAKVDFRRDLLSKDRKNSKAQACLDFHRYLTNSFTHQFIIHADIARSSENPPRGAPHIFAHAVRIAYLLLNVHRNFNSFSALVKSLTSPEVHRIRRLWANLPNRVNQILKELSSYVKKDNDYKVYKDALAQKMQDFRDISEGMIVIPWIQPHYEEIKTITQSYSSGKSGSSSEVILSEPGALKLDSIFSLLERCRTNIASDDDEGRGAGRKGSPSMSRGRDRIVVDGVTVLLPLDLSCLGFGDLGLHHWIVSRVFLTKQQLIDESIEIEPLAENEQLPCVDNDYEDEVDEEDDRISVGQYDLGSDDSGDNIEASTSTVKNDSTTGSTSQIKPFEISSENFVKSELMSLITKAESDGTSSKSAIQTVNSFEENAVRSLVVKQIEESTTPIESIKPVPTNANVGSTSTTTTAAIPIPQSSQRATTPIISPMAKNLNPLASVFIPRSSFSSSSSAIVQGAIDKLAKESMEIEETSKSREPASSLPTGENGLDVNNEDDDNGFVYPNVENENEGKTEEEDVGEFVYKPNGAKEEGKGEEEEEEEEGGGGSGGGEEEEDDENGGFFYPLQDTDDKEDDDDESKADSNSDANKKDIVTKNGENSSSPNIPGGMDNVITKVGKSTDNSSITVRINTDA